MQRATFYVDFCYESGSDENETNVSGRYQFWIDMPDEIFEELYQVWYDNSSELNSWDSNWEGHDKLFYSINKVATKMLSEEMEKDFPENQPLSSWEVLWELSKETADAF